MERLAVLRRKLQCYCSIGLGIMELEGINAMAMLKGVELPVTGCLGGNHSVLDPEAAGR